MSEDLSLEVVTDFLDAVDAGINATRQRVHDTGVYMKACVCGGAFSIQNPSLVGISFYSIEDEALVKSECECVL